MNNLKKSQKAHMIGVDKNLTEFGFNRKGLYHALVFMQQKSNGRVCSITQKKHLWKASAEVSSQKDFASDFIKSL